MGLHIDIYKGKHDCTLNGVSSKAKVLCITNVEGPFAPCEDYPPAKILLEFADNPHMKHVRIVPEKIGLTDNVYGHYGATSDSRFNDAVAKLLGTASMVLYQFTTEKNLAGLTRTKLKHTKKLLNRNTKKNGVGIDLLRHNDYINSAEKTHGSKI